MLAPVRILCVGNIYPPHAAGGGYELTWRSAVHHLRGSGHEVRVLTTDHHEEGVDEPDEADVHRELRWYWRDHEFPRLGWRERIALERHNAATFARHLEEHDPEVVCWWGMGGMSLALIERARRAGLPAVGVVGDEWMRWGWAVDRWQRPFRDRSALGRLAERATGLPAQVDLAGAGIWLFNSEAMCNASQAAVGPLPGARIANPGIDDSLFAPAPSREWSWRLLYLGRMDRRKGVDIAVSALAQLPDEAVIVLQGSGEQGYVDELRAAGGARVQFSREPRERLPEVYANADVVLFPVQWEEPWGLVPLEAMAVGRPVIASGTGGSAEYLRHEDNCLIYQPRASADALAAAIVRLASEPELRARLRDGGLATAARYTETLYNEAIERAIEEAVG
jgi:glycosyltransferase involved in cell wall biosynthesis